MKTRCDDARADETGSVDSYAQRDRNLRHRCDLGKLVLLWDIRCASEDRRSCEKGECVRGRLSSEGEGTHRGLDGGVTPMATRCRTATNLAAARVPLTYSRAPTCAAPAAPYHHSTTLPTYHRTTVAYQHQLTLTLSKAETKDPSICLLNLNNASTKYLRSRNQINKSCEDSEIYTMFSIVFVSLMCLNHR
ncbi:unnamed protein product [Euphydryas editha]|uniref:Uncharacterized protein n=1 Tax=Euphydryas editha TaxID=104508 RepID=A0AAU9UWG2_EUPED|nr:unnamed protein product [Euphydryas editha]